MGVEREDLSTSGKITGLKKAKRPLQAGNEVSRGRQIRMVWTRGRVRGHGVCLSPTARAQPKPNSDPFTVPSVLTKLCICTALHPAALSS